MARRQSSGMRFWRRTTCSAIGTLLAESLRRARHRVDSTGMPRSRHRDQRTAPPAPAAQLPRVLQRHPPASGPPESQPPSAGRTNASGRAHRRDPAGRRTSPLLSARRLSGAGFSGCPRRSGDDNRPVSLHCPPVVLTQTVVARLPWRTGSVHTLTLERSAAFGSAARMRFVTRTAFNVKCSLPGRPARGSSPRPPRATAAAFTLW